MRNPTGARALPPVPPGQAGLSRNKHAGPPGASAAVKPDAREPGLRLRRQAATGLAWGLAVLLAAALPQAAPAQVEAQGKSDLPGQQSMDPEVDPFPFDGRLALRAYFKERLPSMWWANEPEYNLGRFSITIHAPDSWRGNPTAALQALCPQPYSNLWTGLREFELKAMYKNAPWPGVTCRP